MTCVMCQQLSMKMINVLYDLMNLTSTSLIRPQPALTRSPQTTCALLRSGTEVEMTLETSTQIAKDDAHRISELNPITQNFIQNDLNPERNSFTQNMTIPDSQPVSLLPGARPNNCHLSSSSSSSSQSEEQKRREIRKIQEKLMLEQLPGDHPITSQLIRMQQQQQQRDDQSQLQSIPTPERRLSLPANEARHLRQQPKHEYVLTPTGFLKIDNSPSLSQPLHRSSLTSSSSSSSSSQSVKTSSSSSSSHLRSQAPLLMAALKRRSECGYDGRTDHPAGRTDQPGASSTVPSEMPRDLSECGVECFKDVDIAQIVGMDLSFGDGGL